MVNSPKFGGGLKFSLSLNLNPAKGGKYFSKVSLVLMYYPLDDPFYLKM